MALYISLAILIQFLVALSQVIFKIGALKVDFKKPLVYNFKNKFILTSIFLFILVPVLSIITMRVIDLSDFYSFTALSYVFIMLFSWRILKEDIDRLIVIGNFLVIAGVIVFNL
ncbi:MAG: EamA family transporter [Actinobacteria bacterium]|nr:EamA family transporter [Actinomycetota bacterium]